MKRRLLAGSTVFCLTFGFLAFGFFGSATSVAEGGLARSFGAAIQLDSGSGATSLVAPLPSISVDEENGEDSAALVHIVDQPAGPASLIEEISALYVTGRVDADNEIAIATSDTAKVALLESLATLIPPTTEPAIIADALHGVVTLSCNQLTTLKNSSTKARLQAVTNGSLAQRVKIGTLLDTIAAELPVLGNVNQLNVELDAELGQERAAAYNLRVGLPEISALNIQAGTRLVEISIYEVIGENLDADDLNEVTARAEVNMLHVTVLDKITGLPEIDIRVGHAEAGLIGCFAPEEPGPVDVSVTKLVDAIGGIGTISQTGLTAEPGDEVVFSLEVANDSEQACGISQVVDQLPTGFNFVSTDGDLGTGTFSDVTNKITWSGLDIQPGEGALQEIVVEIDEDIPSGIYINRATATGSCGTFNGSASGIEVLGDITVDVLKTISSIAGNAITPTSSLTAKAGDEIVYELSVTNSSAESCTISQVVDQLPAGFLLSSTAGSLGAGTYDASANTVTWDDVEITPGETATQGLVVDIAPTIAAGTYRNRAIATGSCGQFEGSSPAITVPGVLGKVITRGPTPRTGIPDQVMWFGPVLLAAAAAGVTVLRRR